jgi:hypothetical protein
MFVVVYMERDGSWRVAETAIINPDKPEEMIREPIFFEDVDDAINFVSTQFDNYKFEIMKMCALGEVKQHELIELYDDEGTSIIAEYK